MTLDVLTPELIFKIGFLVGAAIALGLVSLVNYFATHRGPKA